MNKESLTDTHFHLDLNDDIALILERARKNNVQNFIISGCDLKGIKEGIEIINRYPGIYLTIGIHPDEIKDFHDDTISYLEKLLLENKKIIGIGEIIIIIKKIKKSKKEFLRLN